ncbi:hypothetical protein BCR34DRAFT_593219 [Clohesyomyces aquaticus]|uniref:AA1-like domain-containing protein n=1 Tax=Clohesyomyces aquaticus TaxID=1231657 RepID=A0A1Y1YL32_9PLEO|nr:hypothetical protein BCR34DRAFT_593219 [Clohesyomyces aquaticus]
MHFPSLFSTFSFSLFLSTTTSALPTTSPSFILSNFTAAVGPNGPGSPSSVHFHLVDPRPAPYSLSVDCSIKVDTNSPTTDTIYRELYTQCGGDGDDAGFILTEGEIVVKRGWREESGAHTIYFARQGTYWDFSANGNATRTVDGSTMYTRTTDWEITVNSASSTT